ncbi:EAL domain-containing protein [Campylobacter sp. RM9344]|uniref:EAL domain-containing protein n=1 Tax=Campylobacter californiensis TaxID=1032243 RepID=A0AAW3ZTV7_9BACT|nr:bifunctional diguanylate cyclase/phosphodiesterase [Campylobacter sp. RM9337]MBE3028933.1 EAL domain-containing protein [Campylobacter sp. RM9344]MBE3607291.1 EAL domain-containing protein [Campylobacter sp. RM9337]
MTDRFSPITSAKLAFILYCVALFVLYSFAIHTKNTILCNIVSSISNLSMGAMITYQIWVKHNFDTFWKWLCIAICFWGISDVFWLYHDFIGFKNSETETTYIVQVMYLVPILSVFTAALLMFEYSMKQYAKMQSFVDISVLIIMYMSFFWLVVFESNIEIFFSVKETFHFLYLVLNVITFTVAFIVYLAIDARHIKRHKSFYMALIAIIMFGIYDMYYSISVVKGKILANTYYELVLEIIFFIVLIASFYAKDGDVKRKFGKNKEAPNVILISKLGLLVSLIIVAILVSGRIDLTWISVVMVLLLFYGVLTHNISNVKHNQALIKKEYILRRNLEGIIKDRIKELNSKSEQLKKLNHIDPLTGALNREYFLEKFGEFIKTKPIDQTTDIYSLNLKRFKVINNVYGRYIADEVLIALVEKFKKIFSKNSLISRFSGSDFVIVSRSGSANARRETINKLLATIQDPITINDHTIHLKANIGIAQSETSEIKPSDLLSYANIALAEAKKDSGKDFVVFSDELMTQMQEQNYINMLMSTMDFDKELDLNFQPQYNLKSEKLTGMEALLYWKSPVKGFIPSSQFIPIAEQSSLIVDIGQWVCNKAIKQMATWSHKYDLKELKLHINVSPKQIDNTNFIQNIMMLLTTNKLEGSSLGMEITEMSLIDNENLVQNSLFVLKNHGITLSIDNFGAGFSSIGYVKKFKFHKLKIAKELIQNIATNSQDKEIVKTIIELAKSMGLKSIAEGIENKEQLEILKELGCDEGQGYLLSRPMKASSFEKLLKKIYAKNTLS